MKYNPSEGSVLGQTQRHQGQAIFCFVFGFVRYTSVWFQNCWQIFSWRRIEMRMHFLLFMCLIFPQAHIIFEVLTTFSSHGTVGLAVKRTKMPNNPTEEGLLSIHSVLLRKDPFLWRAALLFTTLFVAPARCLFVNYSEILDSLSRTPIRDGIIVNASQGMD